MIRFPRPRPLGSAARAGLVWAIVAVAVGLLAGCVPFFPLPRDLEEGSMDVDRNARISAQVLLKSASGATPDPATPITAETIATFAPSPAAVDIASRFFRSRGFEVGPVVGISFSITGTVETFESVFETRLGQTERGGVGSAGDGGLELPLDALPSEVRNVVAAVTFTPPPDFGPGNF